MSQQSITERRPEYLMFVGDAGFFELGQRLADHPGNRGGLVTQALFELATWLANHPTKPLHCAVCYDDVQDNSVQIGRWQQVSAVWLVPNTDQRWNAMLVCADCCPSEQAAAALAPHLPATQIAAVHLWDWNLQRDPPSR